MKRLRCPVCRHVVGELLPDGAVELNEHAAGPTDGNRCRRHRRTPIDREVESALAVFEVTR